MIADEQWKFAFGPFRSFTDSRAPWVFLILLAVCDAFALIAQNVALSWYGLALSIDNFLGNAKRGPQNGMRAIRSRRRPLRR